MRVKAMIGTCIGMAALTSLVMVEVAVLAGAVWGCLNLYSIGKFLECVARQDVAGVFVLGLVKFPLLYGAGFWLLVQFPAMPLVVGFTLLLVAVVAVGLREGMRA